MINFTNVKLYFWSRKCTITIVPHTCRQVEKEGVINERSWFNFSLWMLVLLFPGTNCDSMVIKYDSKQSGESLNHSIPSTVTTVCSLNVRENETFSIKVSVKKIGYIFYTYCTYMQQFSKSQMTNVLLLIHTVHPGFVNLTILRSCMAAQILFNKG